MSLRLRLILALMLTGLASVALVGGVAYLQLHKKFESRPARQASEHFRDRVAAYLEKHGSLSRGMEVQNLVDFMHQRLDGQRSPPPVPPGSGHPLGPGARPPGGPPPFRFILTDESYHVVLGAGIYRHDEVLPDAARAQALPVRVDGVVRAYVSSEGVLSPGPEDLAYLEVMRQALLSGVAAAAVLALLLGALLGSHLSAGLRRLTAAVQAMRTGDLRQQVPMSAAHSSEVASLAAAFNAMSHELASSHESLKASHATILAQSVQLKELSIRDALTGLYNRRHFDESMRLMFDQALRQRLALSLAIADIDGFKRINDSHSHAIGDQVLRQVAEILRSHLRVSDLLARWGGEEFVIALPDTQAPAAAALCDKLRQAVAQFNWEGIKPGLVVTLSFGVSTELGGGASAYALLERADTQLYRAKGSGRNRVCVS